MDDLTVLPVGSPRARVPKPPYRGPGLCRPCGLPILKRDGTPDTRRSWHAECVEPYLALTSSDALRRYIYRRDHGICANCRRHVRDRSEDWQADHVVALILGGPHALDNVQLLCTECHRIKTRADLAERDRRRNGQSMLALDFGE